MTKHDFISIDNQALADISGGLDYRKAQRTLGAGVEQAANGMLAGLTLGSAAGAMTFTPAGLAIGAGLGAGIGAVGGFAYGIIREARR